MNELQGLNLNNYKPLREIVFNHLREAIIKGVLKPGERLMEIQLAEKLGVSRTPVREAIRKLELEGLVIMVARKGAYVADVSLNDIINIFEIRGALEELAAQLATERISDQELMLLQAKHAEFEACFYKDDNDLKLQKDIEFHDIIYKATRNNRLISMLDGLREQIGRYRKTYMNSFDLAHKAGVEHEKLLSAIVNKDGNVAKECARAHIESLKENILQQSKNKLGI
ncbi:GntR family transcriptional regulator [Clostridiaceae bacterium M8S5]|nr:GntR family transcriptional regulator [Clostridiaceae bacterium M8S5]